jgi:hypothetical protein
VKNYLHVPATLLPVSVPIGHRMAELGAAKYKGILVLVGDTLVVQSVAIRFADGGCGLFYNE